VQDLLDAALPSGYFQSGSKPIVRPKREETITKKSAQVGKWSDNGQLENG
jgi:hypothetical protein